MNIFAALKMIPSLFRAGDQLQAKGWYASKTIWFNLLVLALDVAVKVFGADLPIDRETIDALAVGAAAAGNIVLRAVTHKPLAVKTVRQGQAGR